MIVFSLQAPAPFYNIETNHGTQYVADRMGIIDGVPAIDLGELIASGCSALTFIARLAGADMNSVDDQPFQLMVTNLAYRISNIVALYATVSLDTAVGGIYPEADKGGSSIVDAGQLYSDLTAPALSVNLSISAGQGAVIRPAGFVPIFSLTTPQGVPALCDLFLFGDLFGVGP